MDLNLQLNNTYTVLVAGDVDLTQYDATKIVEPYVVYEYNNRHDIRTKAINVYRDFISNLPDEGYNITLRQMLQLKLQDIIEMSNEEYFEIATEGMIIDEKTGNALSTYNSNGKYRRLQEATKETAMPLIDDNFQCIVDEILDKVSDTTSIEKYSQQWDKIMASNTTTKEEYKKLYGTKEVYVSVATNPFFYNAFVSNENGWLEQGDENQIEWVLNFKDRFLKKLPSGTKLKLYTFNK